MNYFGFKNLTNYSFVINNFYAYNYESFNMQFHTHMNAEIMYVEQGECEISIFDKEQKAYTLKKGQFILINSLIKHKLIINKTKPCKMLNLEFSPTQNDSFNVYKMIEDSKELSSMFSIIDSNMIFNDTASVDKIIKLIHSELTSNYQIESSLRVNALIIELLIGIVRCHNNSLSESNIYISKAMDFIKNNFSNDISAEDIANHCFITSVYLQRIIKKKTGKTLLELLTNFRISQAIKFIENTTLPLTDIAFHCGFNSRQNFYVAFKKVVGVSPAVYRENLKVSATEKYKQTPFII